MMNTKIRQRWSILCGSALMLPVCIVTAVYGQAYAPFDLFDDYMLRAGRSRTSEEWWIYAESAREYAADSAHVGAERNPDLLQEVDRHLQREFDRWLTTRTAPSQGHEDVEMLLRAVRDASTADPTVQSHIWEDLRERAPGLDHLIELETQRLLSRSTYDHQSLRRLTERSSPLEIVSYLEAPWLQTHAPPDVRDAALTARIGEMNSRDRTYGESLSRAQDLWQETEAHLLSERLHWEQAMQAAYAEDTRHWENAFRQLAEEQRVWQEAIDELIHAEAGRHRQELSALDLQRSGEAEAYDRAVAARRSAADAQRSVAFELYRASRDAEYTALAALEIWQAVDHPEAVAERQFWQAEAERHAAVADSLAETLETLVEEYAGGVFYGSLGREITEAEQRIRRTEAEVDVWEAVLQYANDTTAGRESAPDTTDELQRASSEHEAAVQQLLDLTATFDALSGELQARRSEQQVYEQAIAGIDREIAALNASQRHLLELLNAPSVVFLEHLVAESRELWEDRTGGPEGILDADDISALTRQLIGSEQQAQQRIYRAERHNAVDEQRATVLHGLSLETVGNLTRDLRTDERERALDTIVSETAVDSPFHRMALVAKAYPEAAVVLQEMLAAAMLEIERFEDLLASGPTDEREQASGIEARRERFAELEVDRIRAQVALERDTLAYLHREAAEVPADEAGEAPGDEAGQVPAPEAAAPEVPAPETGDVPASVLLLAPWYAEPAAYELEDLTDLLQIIDALIADEELNGLALHAELMQRAVTNPALSQIMTGGGAFEVAPGVSLSHEHAAGLVEGWREAHAEISASAAAMRYAYLETYVLTADIIDAARDLADLLPTAEEALSFLESGLQHELGIMIDVPPSLQEQYLETVSALLAVGMPSDHPEETLRIYRREHAVLHSLLADLHADPTPPSSDEPADVLFAEAEDILAEAASVYGQLVNLRSEYHHLYSELIARELQLAEARSHSPESLAEAVHDLNNQLEAARRERSLLTSAWEEAVDELSDDFSGLAAMQHELHAAREAEELARQELNRAQSVDLYARSFSLSTSDVQERHEQSLRARDSARELLLLLEDMAGRDPAQTRYEEALEAYRESLAAQLKAGYLLRELELATADVHAEIHDLEHAMIEARGMVFEHEDEAAHHQWMLSFSELLQDGGIELLHRFSLARYAEQYERYEAQGSSTVFRTPESIVSPALYAALTQGGAFRSPVDLGSYMLEEARLARDLIRSNPEEERRFQEYRAFQEAGAFRRSHELAEVEYLSAPAHMVAHAIRRTDELARRNRRQSGTLAAIGMSYYVAGLASFFSPPLMATLMLRSTLELGLAAAAGRAAVAYEELNHDLSQLSYADDRRHAVSLLETEFRAYVSQATRLAGHEAELEMILGGGIEDLGRVVETVLDSDNPATAMAVSLQGAGLRYTGTDAYGPAGSLLTSIAGLTAFIRAETDEALVNLDTLVGDVEDERQTDRAAWHLARDTFLDGCGEDDCDYVELLERAEALFLSRTPDPASHSIRLQQTLLDAYARSPVTRAPHQQVHLHERAAAVQEYGRRVFDRRDDHDRDVFRDASEGLREALVSAAAARAEQLQYIVERGRDEWRSATEQLTASYEGWLRDRAEIYETRSRQHAARHALMLELHKAWAQDAGSHRAPDRLAVQYLADLILPEVRVGFGMDTPDLDRSVRELSRSDLLSDLLQAAEEGLRLQSRAAASNMPLPSPPAGGFASELEIMRHVQQTRAIDSEEAAHRLSMAHAGSVLHELQGLRDSAVETVASANASIADSVHRTFTQAGFRRDGNAFLRDTLTGSTINTSVRVSHRLRGYEAFTDYRFEPASGLSLAGLARSTSRTIARRVDEARIAIAAELERVFGTDTERMQGGTTDPDAVMEIRRSLERGWLAEILDYGESHETLTRSGSAIVMPGAFGAHVGYAPELYPQVDPARSWQDNIAFAGSGELQYLYGPFLYYQALQARGYAELQQGFHSVRLWDGAHAASLSDVLNIGAGIAGGFVSGGASLALSLGAGALTSALDVVSGEADPADAILRTLKSAASAGVGHVSGAIAQPVSGVLGRGMSGQLAATATELVVDAAGRAVVQAGSPDGFSTEQFLKALTGPQVLARAAGRMTGSLVTGDLTGFSAGHQAAVTRVSSGISSLVELGVDHGLTGSLTLNVLNFADLAQRFGIQGYRDTASAGILELQIGGASSGFRLGAGGVDASHSRLQAVASGLPLYGQQLRISAHRISGKTEYVDGYKGVRSVGTALRALYSYGSESGRDLYEAVLAGGVKLVVGGSPEDSPNGAFIAERIRGSRADIIHLAGLGDRGWDMTAIASRLFAGLVLEHESHRDGVVSAADVQAAETAEAVRARLEMADQMMSEYGVELSHHEITVSELMLFRMAQTLGDPQYFNDFVQLAYAGDRDYFFLPVLTGGDTQTDERYANVALLAGWSREEVDRQNSESLDEAWQRYGASQLYEHFFASKEEFGDAVRRDPALAGQFGYEHTNFISIQEYGCVLFSMAYMLRTATGSYHSILDINAAMVENGLFIDRSLLSSELIGDALNQLSGGDISFELLAQIARPSEDDFLAAHFSDEEYMGLLRVAQAQHTGSEDRHRYGFHSEVLRTLNVDRDRDEDRYRVRSVTTANPYTGSFAHSARTEREIGEFSRLDLFRVVRHAPRERFAVAHGRYRDARLYFTHF
ncbi:MAG: hypothetical protein EA383_16935 [Spirochaetaceae bacterium]|nr:MAG: hypothetical protein EA383_16935 [Spirochaetaceae bacterium]